MIRKTAILSLLLVACLAAPCPGAGAGSQGSPGEGGVVSGGYRLFESTAASINGQVLFRSDLLREACLLRCGAFPGEEPANLPLAEVLERRIREILVLQEDGKLGLAQVDNAALQTISGEATARVRSCADPCARDVDPSAVSAFVKRRLVIRDFLQKRVAVFIEVSDDEVRREIERRVARGEASRDSASEEAIRGALFEEKTARAVRNWYDQVTSKSKIVRSPLEEP
jgi:hypothetical protein